jgi:hypothetical protein
MVNHETYGRLAAGCSPSGPLCLRCTLLRGRNGPSQRASDGGGDDSGLGVVSHCSRGPCRRDPDSWCTRCDTAQCADHAGRYCSTQDGYLCPPQLRQTADAATSPPTRPLATDPSNEVNTKRPRPPCLADPDPDIARQGLRRDAPGPGRTRRRDLPLATRSPPFWVERGEARHTRPGRTRHGRSVLCWAAEKISAPEFGDVPQRSTSLARGGGRLHGRPGNGTRCEGRRPQWPRSVEVRGGCGRVQVRCGSLR